jgi:hypothetical protein
LRGTEYALRRRACRHRDVSFLPYRMHQTGTGHRAWEETQVLRYASALGHEGRTAQHRGVGTYLPNAPLVTCPIVPHLPAARPLPDPGELAIRKGELAGGVTLRSFLTYRTKPAQATEPQQEAEGAACSSRKHSACEVWAAPAPTAPTCPNVQHFPAARPLPEPGELTIR